jgi:hypothetical protein
MCVSFAEVVGIKNGDLTQAFVRPDPQPATLDNDDGHNDDDAGSGGDETNEEDSEDDDEECAPPPRKRGKWQGRNSGKDATVVVDVPTCMALLRQRARRFGMISAAVA